MSTQEDFRFNWLKGGYACISLVPAINEILYWAEREEFVITSDRLRQAVGQGLETCDRDGNVTDHVETLNSAVLVLLSNWTLRYIIFIEFETFKMERQGQFVFYFECSLD